MVVIILWLSILSIAILNSWADGYISLLIMAVVNMQCYISMLYYVQVPCTCSSLKHISTKCQRHEMNQFKQKLNVSRELLSVNRAVNSSQFHTSQSIVIHIIEPRPYMLYVHNLCHMLCTSHLNVNISMPSLCVNIINVLNILLCKSLCAYLTCHCRQHKLQVGHKYPLLSVDSFTDIIQILQQIQNSQLATL